MEELKLKIKEISERIKELRQIENVSVAEMAKLTGVTEQEYLDCENGVSDLNFAFIYRLYVNFRTIVVYKRDRILICPYRFYRNVTVRR